jgi:CheY-like chemotaxis protein
LELAEQMKPDIILLDLMMPEMTGDQVLEKLRATDWGKHIHVIILSNISEDIASPTLRQLGIDRYIVKANYTPTQIVDIIKEVLAAPPAASTR